jgi:hypothetical protein
MTIQPDLIALYPRHDQARRASLRRGPFSSRGDRAVKNLAGSRRFTSATRRRPVDRALKRRLRERRDRDDASRNISPDVVLLCGKRIQIDELQTVGKGFAVESLAAMKVNQGLHTPGIQIIHMLMP